MDWSSSDVRAHAYRASQSMVGAYRSTCAEADIYFTKELQDVTPNGDQDGLESGQWFVGGEPRSRLNCYSSVCLVYAEVTSLDRLRRSGKVKAPQLTYRGTLFIRRKSLRTHCTWPWAPAIYSRQVLAGPNGRQLAAI